MATWHQYGLVTSARGVTFLFNTPQLPRYVALRYLGTGAIVPAYRGVLAIGSRETVGGGGAAVETIFQERVVWYPTQMVQVEVNQDCEFLYYVVGKKATHVGEQFAVLGFY